MNDIIAPVNECPSCASRDIDYIEFASQESPYNTVKCYGCDSVWRETPPLDRFQIEAQLHTFDACRIPEMLRAVAQEIEDRLAREVELNGWNDLPRLGSLKGHWNVKKDI